MTLARGFRRQAILLTAVPLGFFLLLLVMIVILVDSTSRSGNFVARSAATLTAADRLMEPIGEANRVLADYGKTHRAADARAWRAIPHTMRAKKAVLLAAVSRSPDVAPATQRYMRAIDAALIVLQQYYEASFRGNTVAAHTIAEATSTRAAGAELTAAKTAFDSAEQAHTITGLVRRREFTNRLQIAVAAVVLLGCIATFAVARIFGVQTVGRLERLASNARRIGAGLPTVNVEGEDEIAELDRVYRDMTTRLLDTHREREHAVAALERERSVASTLQRALLPSRLPEIPGMRFDAAYITPSDGPEIGGDWFDVFRLSERHVGLSIGDVAGHGLRAAITMGALRQTIRAAARIAHVPSRVLQHANRMVCLDDPGTIVTAFYGVFDRHEQTLTYAFAGHPPPIVIEMDGSLTMLPGDGLMLGIDAEATFSDRRRVFENGSSFVLYTDGIIEARRDYLAGLDAFQEAISAEAHYPSLNMADGIQLRVFDGISPHDDSAVLVVSMLGLEHQRTEGSIQSWRFDGRDAAATHRVRRDVMVHLEDGVPAEHHFNVEVIVGEALSNIARHTPGPAQISTERRDGAIVLHIDDEGPPFEITERPDPDVFDESGRGIALMRALSETMRVQRLANGNRLSITLSARDPFAASQGAVRLAAVRV